MYGDPAYTGSSATMGAYRRPRGGELTPAQADFNKQMSKKRVSVEHGYGFVQKYWTKSAFHLTNQVGSSLMVAYYLVLCLMSNIMTCLQENQINKLFNCLLPLLNKYFDGLLIVEREDMENVAV